MTRTDKICNPRIAIDFDGTCVINEYPYIGEEMPGCIETIKALQTYGYLCIIWTCRQGPDLDEVKHWFNQRNVSNLFYNESPSDEVWEHPSRKIYADYYIDDHDPRGFPGWDVIGQILLSKEIDV